MKFPSVNGVARYLVLLATASYEYGWSALGSHLESTPAGSALLPTLPGFE